MASYRSEAQNNPVGEEAGTGSERWPRKRQSPRACHCTPDTQRATWLTRHSVYVQNLEERVKIETLTEALTAIFSEFGSVVDVVAKKNLNAKGQAFVVFDHPDHAATAIDEVQGFELFGKPMRLSMARTRSDKTVEMKSDANTYEAHKRHRQAEKGKRVRCRSHCGASMLNDNTDKRRALEAADGQRQAKRGAAATQETHASRLAKPTGLKSTGPSATNAVPDEYLPPNKTLFLQNVPDEYDVEALTAVFGRFEGLREIRLVPGRKGIAFVEYQGEQGAIAAKENTAGMTLGDKTVKVTYQRQ